MKRLTAWSATLDQRWLALACFIPGSRLSATGCSRPARRRSIGQAVVSRPELAKASRSLQLRSAAGLSHCNENMSATARQARSLPNCALLDQGGSAALRRGPTCAGLCLGRPARRTPGQHAQQVYLISPAHSARIRRRGRSPDRQQDRVTPGRTPEPHPLPIV